MSKKTIDFIVIGAAKSGTTTLFELLSKHPDIYLPPQKEMPFFTENRLFSKGVDYFIKRVYKNVPAEVIAGKITPQYMSGQRENHPEIIAKRIKESLPNVKIIAILRDPVERSFSFYKMSVRLGYEKRSYPDAVIELLKPENLEYDRKHRSWTNTYVVGGEYGRILQYYYEHFDRCKILVLFTQDLRNSPETVIKKILNFIGANEDYVPEEINKIFHSGGLEPRLRLLTPGYIYKIPLVNYIWQNLVPFTIRRRINHAISHWNIKKAPKDDSADKTTNEKPDQATNEKLMAHFKPDAALLEKLVVSKLPWSS